MYTFFQSSVYNQFFKAERKKQRLTLKEMGELCHFSYATISQFENDDDLLNHKHFRYYASFYHIDADAVISFERQVEEKVEKLVHHLIYLEDDLVSDALEDVRLFFEPFRGTVLFDGWKFCYWIYRIYNGEEVSKQELIEFENLLFKFTIKYQILGNIYICLLFSLKSLYDFQKTYLLRIEEALKEDSTYQSMYHYILAIYSLGTHQVEASMLHATLAEELLMQERNERRIINIKILSNR